MKIETNKLMDKRLKGESVKEWMAQYPLTTKLKNILKQGVVKIEQKIFLSNFYNYIKSSPYDDETGFEMWVNKFHIDAFIPEKKLTAEYSLQQGILFAFSLKD